jgi:hypothetical protein
LEANRTSPNKLSSIENESPTTMSSLELHTASARPFTFTAIPSFVAGAQTGARPSTRIPPTVFFIIAIHSLVLLIAVILRSRGLPHAGLFSLRIRHWCYNLVIGQRQAGTSFVTPVRLASIGIILAGNVFSLCFQLTSSQDLPLRALQLFLCNFLLLLFGAGNSVILNRAGGLGRELHEFLHRWVGRICLMEGLLYLINRLIASKSGRSLTEIIVS